MSVIAAAIEHAFLLPIGQAEAAKQDVQASTQAVLQFDACVWHCFLQLWPEHGEMHDARVVAHVCAHADAVAAHAVGHEASGCPRGESAAASPASAAWPASRGSGPASEEVLDDPSMTFGWATSCLPTSCRAPSSSPTS